MMCQVLFLALKKKISEPLPYGVYILVEETKISQINSYLH